MFCSSCGKQTSDTSAFCGSCGRPVVGYSVGGASTASATPAYAGAGAGVATFEATGGVPQTAAAAYAGFWLRFVAAIIDGLVIGVPIGILVFMSIASMLPTIMHTAQQNSQDPRVAMAFVATILPRIFFLLVVALAGGWLYWGLMESSSWQATLGKKALGLYVTDLSGNRPTFGRASGRYFAGRGISYVPSIGGLYYLVDCIVAGFTERKQALHDMIAGCLVLRNN
jgi:uncharacterized RDD family membrane protein YckC